MRAIAAFIISLAMMACSDSSTIDFEQHDKSLISIAHLKTMATAASVALYDNITIEGYVIANDLFGEYYKTIVVGDQSGAILVAVDTNHTAEEFPLSAHITIHCTGLAVGTSGGGIMLGAVPQREYTIDRIQSKEFDRYIEVDKQNPIAMRATRKQISEIGADDISNYVSIDDVAFVGQEGMYWCERDAISGDYQTTILKVTDSGGNTIGVRTISTCDYRAERLPEGRGTLYGIVERIGGEYTLRVVNHGVVFTK